MTALLAMLLFEEMETKLDQLKVLKMILIHDIVEAVVGDVPIGEVSDRQQFKEANERQAILEIERSLSEKTGGEIRQLWEEFEARETPEAMFVKALDRIEASIQHNISPISTWDEQDYRVCIGYKSEYFEFNVLISRLRELIDVCTLEKIKAAERLDRLLKDQIAFANRGKRAKEN